MIRQLTFAAPGRVEWRETGAPSLGSAAAAIVRPLVLGRCDLDTAYLLGLAPMAAGEPIGHEMIGEVVDVGDGVTLFRPGQRVIVPSQISCGACLPCRRGFTGRCESVPFGAGYGMGRPGAYGCAAADLVRVPYADAMLVGLPDGADPVALIGAADMAADSWRAVGPQLAERPGASVLVVGGRASIIGVYAAGLAVALGAERVDYADDDPHRLAAAASYGAQAMPYEAITGPYEIVVDACGTPETLIQAVRATAPEGHLTSVTIHFGATTGLPLAEMYHKGIFFRTGRANVRTNIPPTLACCHDHGFAPDRVQTTRFGFDDAPEAWMTLDALRVAASRA